MTLSIPGIRYSVSVYLISESKDAEIIMTIDSPVVLPPVIAAPSADAILRQFGCDAAQLFGGADDWRLMTIEEVADYRERQNA